MAVTGARVQLQCAPGSWGGRLPFGESGEWDPASPGHCLGAEKLPEGNGMDRGLCTRFKAL